jgi:hypothetical protein
VKIPRDLNGADLASQRDVASQCGISLEEVIQAIGG